MSPLETTRDGLATFLSEEWGGLPLFQVDGFQGAGRRTQWPSPARLGAGSDSNRHCGSSADMKVQGFLIDYIELR